MLVLLIALALIFTFTNGFHDSASIVATVISSRAMRPRPALLMTAAAELVAPFLFGVAVAVSIGKGVLDPAAITPVVVIAALGGAVGWNLITWLVGISSSSGQALVGGMLGAAIASSGLGAIQWAGLGKILLALLLTPPLGFAVGYLFMNLTLNLFANATPRINQSFKRLQIFTALTLALAHGTNDSQKAIGMITLGLVASGHQPEFSVPSWVILISAAAMSLGTLFGGWRLISTLGGRIYKIRPVHALTSQAASAGVILGSVLLGGPASTTQVIGSAVMGAGAAERLKKVRWQVAQTMLVTWALTIPASALLSALLFLVLREWK